MQPGQGIWRGQQPLRGAVRLNSMRHQYTQRFGRYCLQRTLPTSISASFDRATL